jgi:hypothetical protein
MKIFKQNDNEFEYEINNATYQFEKNAEEDLN